jgi:hypothetical protein
MHLSTATERGEEEERRRGKDVEREKRGSSSLEDERGMNQSTSDIVTCHIISVDTYVRTMTDWFALT